MPLRRLIGAAAIGCALLLAGCQTPATSSTSPGIGASIGATIGTIAQEKVTPATVVKVQTAATRICGFEPTAATVVRLLGTVTGYGLFVDPVTDIADRICVAVTRTASAEPMASYASLKRRKAKASDVPKGEVDGISVRGRFVKKEK